MTPLNTIFTWFETGDFPTQQQFQSTFASFFHKEALIPVASIEGLAEMFEKTLNAEALETHIGDPETHSEFLAKIDAANLSATNVAAWKSALGITEIATVDAQDVSGNVYDKAQVETFINNLKNADADINAALDSLESLLSSDDVNLDELQEIVNYVKQNREALELLQNASIGNIDDDSVINTNTFSGLSRFTNQKELNLEFITRIKRIEQVPADTRYEETVSASGVITHELNTYDVQVTMYDTGTRYDASGRVSRPTTNSVNIDFDTPPTSPIKVIVRAI